MCTDAIEIVESYRIGFEGSSNIYLKLRAPVGDQCRSLLLVGMMIQQTAGKSDVVVVVTLSLAPLERPGWISLGSFVLFACA